MTVELIFPLSGIVTPEQVKQIVLAKTELVTAKHLSHLTGKNVPTTSAILSGWKKSQTTLVLKHQGLNHCPLYTLNPTNSFRPYPAMKEIISILEPKMGPWQMTFWFMCSTNYLGGKTPRELLVVDPEFVIRSAHDEVLGGLHG